jgi:hypothetical protein
MCFDQDSEESRASALLSVLVPDRKGGREMVKQRFLTHFKPWLFAVIKVVGLIVGYQLFDETRTQFQYTPLNSVDVVVAATVVLLAISLLCGLWAWGEWCWFKLRGLRRFSSELKRAFNNRRRPRTIRTSRPVAGTMV